MPKTKITSAKLIISSALFLEHEKRIEYFVVIHLSPRQDCIRNSKCRDIYHIYQAIIGGMNSHSLAESLRQCDTGPWRQSFKSANRSQTARTSTMNLSKSITCVKITPPVCASPNSDANRISTAMPLHQEIARLLMKIIQFRNSNYKILLDLFFMGSKCNLDTHENYAKELEY